MKTRKKKPNRRTATPLPPNAEFLPGRRATLEWIRQDLYSSHMLAIWYTVEATIPSAARTPLSVTVRARTRDEALVRFGVKMASILAEGDVLEIHSVGVTPLEKETKTGGKP